MNIRISENNSISENSRISEAVLMSIQNNNTLYFLRTVENHPPYLFSCACFSRDDIGRTFCLSASIIAVSSQTVRTRVCNWYHKNQKNLKIQSAVIILIYCSVVHPKMQTDWQTVDPYQTALWAVWSVSPLFAQTCLSELLGLRMYMTMTFLSWKVSHCLLLNSFFFFLDFLFF